MTTTEQTQTSPTAEQTEMVLDITESMMRTGHTVSVYIEDEQITVCGDKPAALGRCATITGSDIEWIF